MPEESGNTAEILGKLELNKGHIKSQITRLQTYLDNFGSSGNHEEIAARLDKTSFLLEHFNEIQTDIETLTGNISQDAEREEFESKFFKAIGKAKQMLADFFKAQNLPPFPHLNTTSIANINTPVEPQSPVRLPPIHLPEFHGAYNQWLTFYDIFNSLIHSNTQLNDVQKFFYLKSCLKGEAAQLLHSIEISNQNYGIAWGMLKDRFENKRLIVHTHIKHIFDGFTLKHESHSQLRNLLDNFNKNLRALNALGQPTNTWDTLLIYILGTKLDSSTKREWEDYLNKEGIDFPTVSQLTDFLAKRCNFLETLENKNKPDRVYHGRVLTHVITGKVSCAFCRKNHLNFQCEKIQSMPRNDLYSEIKKHKLCINCLRPFHDYNSCNSAGCKHCGRKHNSLLHLFYNTGSGVPSNINTAENNTVNTPGMSQDTQMSTQTLVLTKGDQNIINDNKKNQNIDNASLNQTSPITPVTMHCLSSENKQVMLATAIIKILSSDGNIVEARAILDSASQSNFITESLAKRLNLKTQNFHIPVAGINNSLSKISKKAQVTFLSQNEKYRNRDSFLIINKILIN